MGLPISKMKFSLTLSLLLIASACMTLTEGMDVCGAIKSLCGCGDNSGSNTDETGARKKLCVVCVREPCTCIDSAIPTKKSNSKDSSSGSNVTDDEDLLEEKASELKDQNTKQSD